MTEIERDAKISRIRGENSGTWHCALRKTNKIFLARALVQTVNHNNREVERHRDRSFLKLEKHRSRYSIEKMKNDRHYIRNQFVRRMNQQMDCLCNNLEFERTRNARKKAEQLPTRESLGVKFVKARDLDERVLIPGQPKQGKIECQAQN